MHLASGHSRRAVPILGQALALADELGDEALATLPSLQAAYIKMDSDPQAVLRIFDHALELASQHGNPDLEAYALSSKGMDLGRFAEAELFAAWAYLDMGNAPAGLNMALAGYRRDNMKPYLLQALATEAKLLQGQKGK